MRRFCRALSALVLCLVPFAVAPASAHPAPFSYLDIVFRNGGIEGTLVIHVIDAAHDLGITPFERLMENAVAEANRQNIADLLTPRMMLRTDQRLTIQWTSLEVLREDLALRLKYRIQAEPAGSMTIDTNLFPVRSAAPDLRQHLRGRQPAAAADLQRRQQRVRLLRRHHAGHAGGDAARSSRRASTTS